MLSCATAFALLALRRGIRLPGRADWPAVLAVGALQLGTFFALAHAAVAWVPAVCTVGVAVGVAPTVCTVVPTAG